MKLESQIDDQGRKVERIPDALEVLGQQIDVESCKWARGCRIISEKRRGLRPQMTEHHSWNMAAETSGNVPRHRRVWKLAKVQVPRREEEIPSTRRTHVRCATETEREGRGSELKEKITKAVVGVGHRRGQRKGCGPG